MYIYNPDTYNKMALNEKKLTMERLLSLQIKYRESVEIFFKKVFNFQKVDSSFYKIGCIPLNDKEYNFYHKYSTLGSQFVYLRNNYHIERLNLEEIQYIEDCILENKFLDDNFIFNTAMNVMMEEEMNTFYNYINLENSVLSKSFVFEFSLDSFGFNEVSQMKEVEKLIKEIFKDIQNNFKSKLNVPLVYIIYFGIPDLYKKDVQIM